MDKIKLFHGSDKIIEKPIYKYGKLTNDFGVGFYLTRNLEIAKEWAIKNKNINGFVNEYELDVTYLRILDLTSDEYNILNWIAVLLKYRVFKVKYDISNMIRKFIIDNYYVDVEKYDVVIGYRADDSYYDFVNAFLNNTITINQLKKIMSLGDLGKQIVIKSKYAFDNLHFVKYHHVDASLYFLKRDARMKQANYDFNKIASDFMDDGDRAIDIMKARKK